VYLLQITDTIPSENI